MKPRIKSHFLLWLLWIADRSTRNALFNPLHVIVKKFYVGPWTRFLEKKIQKDSAVHIRLRPRHSCVENQSFSLFRSDVDYSAIVPDETKTEDKQKIRSAYHKTFRRIPFLGELEVYTQSQVDLQEELKRRTGKFLNQLRLLRKLVWLQNRTHLTSRYHREKNELAQREIFRRLTGRHPPAKIDDWISPISQNIETLINEYMMDFHPPMVDRPIVFKSSFLGWSIVEKDIQSTSVELFQLFLTKPAAIALMSLLPDAPPSSLTVPARSHRILGELYRAILAMELLTCFSVELDAELAKPELTNWIEKLGTDLWRQDPTLAQRVFNRKTDRSQNLRSEFQGEIF